MLCRVELVQLYLRFSFEETLVSWILSVGLQSHCSEPVNSCTVSRFLAADPRGGLFESRSSSFCTVWLAS